MAATLASPSCHLLLLPVAVLALLPLPSLLPLLLLLLLLLGEWLRLLYFF